MSTIPWCSVSEASRRMNVSRYVINQMCLHGKLVYRLTSRGHEIAEDSVLKYQDALTSEEVPT